MFLKISDLVESIVEMLAVKFLLLLLNTSVHFQPHRLPEMRLIEMGRVHSDWVRQVSFYSSLHCIVSCSTCPEALLMCDLAGSKTHNMFRVEKV